MRATPWEVMPRRSELTSESAHQGGIGFAETGGLEEFTAEAGEHR